MDEARLELQILARLASIHSSLAQTLTGEAMAEIPALRRDIKRTEIEPGLLNALLKYLDAAESELQALRVREGAAELWSASSLLWERVLPPESKPEPPPVATPTSMSESSAAKGSTLVPVEIEDSRTTPPREGGLTITLPGPELQHLSQAARTLRARPDTLKILISRGELSAEQLEPDGPLFVTKASMVAYKTRLVQKTAAAGRKTLRH